MVLKYVSGVSASFPSVDKWRPGKKNDFVAHISWCTNLLIFLIRFPSLEYFLIAHSRALESSIRRDRVIRDYKKIDFSKF